MAAVIHQMMEKSIISCWVHFYL